jgi:hypothetical protein
MTSHRISRYVCVSAVVMTLALLLVAAGPFGNHRASGDLLASLLLLPVLAAWAVGPYAVANRFAQDVQGAAVWLFVLVQIAVGLPVLAIYADAFVFRPDTDPQIGLVFAIFPIYQFVAVLAAYYGVRLWRRFNSPREGG